jgi:hypothetical protein
MLIFSSFSFLLVGDCVIYLQVEDASGGFLIVCRQEKRLREKKNENDIDSEEKRTDHTPFEIG